MNKNYRLAIIAVLALLALLAAPSSLFAARCSLLAAPSSLFAARCSLLAAPSLIVVVSFDQMRGDYAARFEKFYASKNGGGFARIRREGIDFVNCYYGHASNITGPGHASLLTGCYPEKTGIVGNDFCDNITHTCGYCAQDESKTYNAGKLLVPTLGDMLKQRSPKSKTVGIALKDRAAILMAGKGASACVWYDAEAQQFATSASYPNPTWLKNVNSRVRTTRYAQRVWGLQIPDSLGPALDLIYGEGRHPNGDSAFPYEMPAASDKRFSVSFLLSPFSMDFLFDAALLAIEREKLGRDKHTDLLCIGVSTTDYIGHLYGPDSREIQELYLHADLAMERLINRLDKAVGRKNYVLVVTSDHGVAPIPEVLKVLAEQQHVIVDAGRISKAELKSITDSAVASKLGPKESGGSYVKQAFEPSIYLDVPRRNSTDYAVAVNAAVEALRKHPGLEVVVSSLDLAANRKPEMINDTTWAYVRKSYHPERSGDIVLYPKRYWIIGGNVATHGTPHDYDRWVPMMFLGGGLRPQSRPDSAAPVDIAPTLGKMLGIEMPGIDGRALELR
ncbi:MAG: alkaline phosphatase family protein [Ignavibacteria bacterium]|jgi:predicted AlkP superfamily pyrophosphatase or phosphodiesterase